ncbi:MAG: DnaB-like helicase N-terminal domain-containing protein [Hyphomicrobiaceae bacterium]
MHQQIYETAAKLIASGKQATPITLKTFFKTFFESAEPIGSGLSVPAYLGQLAANATTIINVRDYGPPSTTSPPAGSSSGSARAWRAPPATVPSISALLSSSRKRASAWRAWSAQWGSRAVRLTAS